MASILITGLTTLDLIFKLDRLPDSDQKYRANAGSVSGGGNAGNAAVAATRLGGSVSIFSEVVRDEVGKLIMDGLEKENVNTQAVMQVENFQSSFSSIQIDKSGARQITNFRSKPVSDNFQNLLKLPI